MMIVKEIEQVTLKHLGRDDHWLEPRAHRSGIPLHEEAQSCPCIGTFPKMAKLFFKHPGSTHFEIPIEQIAQPSTPLDVEVFRREEKKKFAARQGLFSFILELTVLSVPHLIDGFVEILGDMEAVMNNFRPEASWFRRPPGKSRSCP
jgi:hypothetical protein